MSDSAASSSTSARRPAAIRSGQGSPDGRLEGGRDMGDENVDDGVVGLEEAGLLVVEDLVEGRAGRRRRPRPRRRRWPPRSLSPRRPAPSPPAAARARSERRKPAEGLAPVARPDRGFEADGESIPTSVGQRQRPCPTAAAPRLPAMKIGIVGLGYVGLPAGRRLRRGGARGRRPRHRPGQGRGAERRPQLHRGRPRRALAPLGERLRARPPTTPTWPPARRWSSACRRR